MASKTVGARAAGGVAKGPKSRPVRIILNMDDPEFKADAAAREDARLRRSMLHRLYAMFLSRRVARHVSPEADPYDRSGALEEALHAQAFFDAEVGDGGS
jgi:hypothetical protein